MAARSASASLPFSRIALQPLRGEIRVSGELLAGCGHAILPSLLAFRGSEWVPLRGVVLANRSR